MTTHARQSADLKVTETRSGERYEVRTVVAVTVTVHLVCAIWAATSLSNKSEAAEQARAAALAAAAALPKLDPVAYARGQQLYGMACTACHGPDGRGVYGLGKDLVKSRFTRQLDDAQLAAFIIAGRAADDLANTTRVPMPPKGGRPDFSDANVADVVTYLRGLSDPRRQPPGRLPVVEVVVGDAAPGEPVAVAAPSASSAAAAVTSATPAAAPPVAEPSAVTSATPVRVTLALDPQAVARGKRAFVSCMACHGKDAKGVKNMGKSLVANPFVNKLDDPALVDFIKKGRGPTDPANTTKIAMPPKGGNPALKDEQLRDIVAYIRSLNGAAAAPSLATATAAAPTPAAAAPRQEPAVTVATAPPPAAPAAPAAPAPAAPPAKLTVAPTGDTIARGKRAFVSCIACHGKDATGVKNMGKDLVNSPFVATLSDAALVEFIKKGRGPTDPDNTTKIGMPPKGGNPALKEEQIKDIVAYLRSLKQQSARTE